LELAPRCVTDNPYGAIATIAPYGKEKCIPILHMSVSLSMSVSISVTVGVSVSVSVSFSVSVSVSVNVSVSIKYGAMNIFVPVRRGNYSVHFRGPYKVARKIKGLLT
jgi:hypothetical protein